MPASDVSATGHRWALQSGKCSDYTIKCQGAEFTTHKTLLMLHCQYFAALFNSNFEETINGCSEFDDVDPDIMAHLLDYIYRGNTEWEVPEHNLITMVHIWILADRLLADDVKAAVEDKIDSKLGTDQSPNKVADTVLLDLVFNHPACADSFVADLIAEAAWARLFKGFAFSVYYATRS
ncbi:Kelch-like protein 30 [Colletotrichum orbiculare MAFF 240422]|uniref:Kelch-like protein 30 n=1 Tax=Colletotrichum orbiculare (strain 104-T / ATCC 96160 / CBS 514.97 / LARS 414 / MAFF 240422) TaxID=1213857 RepID=A0A484FEN2_COLOR|nr:Kelch-like protein 30 [Colletotrichum orbiculare MAFF 240422]